MPIREYRCAECGGTFTHECRGRPRVCCEGCAPIRKRRQIVEWDQTPKGHAARRDYQERSRGQNVARAARWNRENRERRAEILRKYHQQEHVRLRQNGRNRVRDVRGFAPVLLADPCSYCGAPAEQLDHIDPLAKGGDNAPTNLTAACGHCNRSKHAKSLLIFLLDKR